jgi:hypothetical protein
MSIASVPFAAIGTLMAYLTLSILLRVAIAQGWPTVPAMLQSVELKSSGSSAVTVATTYTYTFQGKQFTGHRFSFYGPDNLGSFFPDAYKKLHGYLERKEPYPVHVNPKSPSQAVLMPVLRWEAIGFYLVLMVVFGVAGWSILISSCQRIIRARKEAALTLRYPDEPWKQRVEWSKPFIKSSQTKDAVVEVFLALFWNAATFPVLLVIPRELANGRYVVLTFLIIPLFGIGLVFWALVAIARAARFARTYFYLDTMPGRPGQQLRGHINGPKALAGTPGVALTLRCERTAGSRASQAASPSQPVASGTEDIWHHDWPAQVSLSQNPAGGATIAVVVDLPPGYPSSWRGQDGDQFAWLLAANAPMKGADFSVEFEIPVFDSGGSSGFTIPTYQPPITVVR